MQLVYKSSGPIITEEEKVFQEVGKVHKKMVAVNREIQQVLADAQAKGFEVRLDHHKYSIHKI